MVVGISQHTRDQPLTAGISKAFQITAYLKETARIPQLQNNNSKRTQRGTVKLQRPVLLNWIPEALCSLGKVHSNVLSQVPDVTLHWSAHFLTRNLNLEVRFGSAALYKDSDMNTRSSKQERKKKEANQPSFSRRAAAWKNFKNTLYKSVSVAIQNTLPLHFQFQNLFAFKVRILLYFIQKLLQFKSHRKAYQKYQTWLNASVSLQLLFLLKLHVCLQAYTDTQVKQDFLLQKDLLLVFIFHLNHNFE